jgi:hypothetical protein
MMPEEIAFARRRTGARRASLRLDGRFFLAALISLLLFVPPVLVGWKVGSGGGITGFAMAIVAGGIVSVLVTLLAARVYMRVTPGDRLFADATLTGWVRRGRAERQVAVAQEIFDDPNVASIPLHVDRLINVAGSIEARDARTHRHSGRVALHAVGAGKHLGLNAEELARLKAAAKLHDVGALRKPIWAEPTDEEALAVALASADLVEFTGDRRLISALRHQHEHFDGSGLPDGLAGDAIPLTARVIAVADAYDTVTRERGQAAAMAELNAGAGSKFDPDVVEAFAADAQASPLSALRGAVAGVIPRAEQGVVEILRGSASVAAAASIATTAVVATGVGVAPPVRDHDSASPAGAATAAVVTRAPGTSSDSKSSEKVRHRSGVKRKSDAKEKVESKSENGTVKAKGTNPGGTSGGNEQSSKSDSGSSNSSANPTKSPSATQPVEDVVTGVGQTVDNTVDTVDQVVTDVVDTVNQTTQNVGGTVDGVVGGLTGGGKK